MSAVWFENVCKDYKKFSIKNLTFGINKGNIVGIIGENGAGKTTMLKLMLGLVKNDSGNISQIDLEKTGVVFDDCPYPEILTPLDICLILKKSYQGFCDERFLTLLDEFSVDKSKKVKDFSRGMTMKIQIAACLARDINLLILDEATNGLDPVSKDSFWDRILDFTKNEENTVIISSHIISDIEKMCDDIMFIKNGEIALFKTKDDIIADYGVLKCTKEQYLKMDKSLVIGSRESEYVVECLVLKSDYKGLELDRATVEDVFLYSVRGS